jgi:thymidylate synthase
MDACSNLIIAETISAAWIEVLRHLLNCGGHCYNLVVQVRAPLSRDISFEESLDTLCMDNNLLTIKHIAYTIFPKSLCDIYGNNYIRFFDKYINRVFPVIKTSWGTYFHRMINWTADHGRPPKNQLQGIIEAINERERIHKSAYTIQIGSPWMHFGRVRGAPCLNYISLQLQENRVMNLMAVFRNHYLFPRIYGNYVGLGQLLEFLCEQTGFNVGMLTSISSHAELSNSGRPPRPEIRQFLDHHAPQSV